MSLDPQRGAPFARAVTRREILGGFCRTGACALAAQVLAGCEVAELHGTGGSGVLDFDVATPAFAPLAQVGGAVAVDAFGHPLLLIRTADAEIVALSRTCTHQQCDLGPQDAGTWVQAAQRLECGCHGSQFAKTGAVLKGPAQAPLASYPVEFQAGKGTVTV